MNPLVNDVVAAFDRVPREHPTAIEIDRTGVDLPQGEHFEGIQRLSPDPELLVITSASSHQAYFVTCDMASDGLSGRARSPVTMARSPFRHSGGCQVVDRFLVVGVEDPDNRQTSEIQFWDFTRFPTQLISMTVPRSGDYQVSTAGAVGLSSFHRGAALAVATWDADTVDFYTSPADPVQGSPFELQFTWTKDGADTSEWVVDKNFGHYQSVNLVTQRDGQLFLVGFNRTDSGDDFMDLFAVNMDLPPESALIKLRKKHMVCTHGCSFDAGAGIFVASAAGLEVLAVNGDTSNDEDTIQVNLFRAP